MTSGRPQYFSKNPKYNKKTALILLLLFSIFLALFVTSYEVYSFLTENNYQHIKTNVKNKIKSHGYDLEYSEIIIKPSLVPSVSFNNVIFKNSRLNNEPLFQADKIVVNFKFLPLIIKKELNVEELIIEDAKVFVKRDLDGNSNWISQSEEKITDRKQVVNLSNVKLNNVIFSYSEQDLPDRAFLIEEASLSYSKIGELKIDNLKSVYNKKPLSAQGQIKDFTGLLTSKGTEIDIELRSVDTLFVKLNGKLGAENKPNEQGIEFSVEGENIAKWLSPYVLNIPTTENFLVKGKVFAFEENVSFKITESFFKNKHVTINANGGFSYKQELIMDMSVNALGKDLSELSNLYKFPETINPYFTSTTQYALSAKLKGSVNKLEASLVKYNAVFLDHEIAIQGGIKNLNKMAGVGLSISAKGVNIADLQFLVESNMPDGYTLPESQAYQLNFNYGEKGPEWYVESLKGELLINNNKLFIRSIEKTQSSREKIHLKVQTSGGDLKQLAQLLKFENIPDNIQHQIELELNGDLKELVVSKINTQIDYKSTTITASGNLENLNDLKGFDLDLRVVGFESNIAEMLSVEGFNENAINLSGQFSGNFKEFSLAHFLYQGARGKSSGDVFVDMDGKPRLQANLGDTRLILLENQNNELDGLSEIDKKHASSEQLDETILNFKWMDNLDIDVEYKSLFVVRDKAELEILGSKVLMRAGRMQWSPLQVNYRGKVTNNSLEIDAKSDQINFTIHAVALDLGALLKDLGWFNRFSGLADIDVDFKSKGLTSKELVSNLSGEGKIIIHQSSVSDFGSASMNYVKALTPWRKKIADLEMNCMLASLQTDKGIVKIKHLYIDAKDMYLTGGGKLNLNESTLDFALAPRAKNKNFLDANVSLFVKGSVSDPTVQVGKLSAVSDVGLKYGQWALLGPLSLALPKIKFNKIPSCEQAIQSL